MLEGENCRLVRAVIQPMTQRSDEGKLPTAVGRMDEGRYLYLGPPEEKISARGTVILWRERRFDVMSAHPIYVEGEISHWWGVLTEKEGIA